MRALIWRTDLVVMVLGFLIFCASSRIIVLNSNFSNSSKSRRNKAYVVITRSDDIICLNIFSRRVPYIIRRRKLGTNFSASLSQFGNTEVGTIIRFGPSYLFSTMYCINANVCMVLPSPISSAKIPPKPYSDKKLR